jgi:hypothetical protein
MPTNPPPSGDPYARGSVIHGFRAAVLDLGGEDALRQVADRLPVTTRLATIDQIVLPFEWVPIEHAVAWHDAIWSGPARSDERELGRLVSRSIELGFGRFKSAFFSGITPDRLVERAPELWRWQHTHGELSATVDGGTGVVVLRDHPYVEHPASRRVTAESYRHIVTMVGGRDVRVAWADRWGEAHPAHPTAPRSTLARHSLVVQLSWRLP